MLTRLKVSGFKNLVDVDVRFGPFTCIAGVNGVGKSNLFDAIHFLSALADRPLLEGAKSVRDESGRTTDVRSLFHKVGTDYDHKMSFEAEMIVPLEGSDDLGQAAKATTTFLRYTLVLGYRGEDAPGAPGPLEIRKEELSPIRIGAAPKHLLFPHNVSGWRRSAVLGRRVKPFISTSASEPKRIIKLHQDNQNSTGGGRALERSAFSLPRTVLSSVTAAESPTALLAKREMASWRPFQLEPSSLRKPDEFTAPARLGADGSHLASTLYRLARSGSSTGNGESQTATSEIIYAQLANRLAELVEDIREVRVDRDERRELYTVQVTGMDHTTYSARALSDGTLRFLALAVLELDPEAQGLLCLEEPENGIHPRRIQAMLGLLQDIATDPDEPIGPDNPLRQVIVNTHSPVVVAQVPEDSLLLAQLKDTVSGERRFKRLSFSCLPDTWRESKSPPDEKPGTISRGDVIGFLSPIAPEAESSAPHLDYATKHTKRAAVKTRRVVDRGDISTWLIPEAAPQK
jgi:predicted ATPase